jgi:DNA-binding SARP family transcriptional activator
LSVATGADTRTRTGTAAIRLLGGLRASAGALPPVDPQPGRVSALLAMLALAPGRVVSAQRLMHQLWDDAPPQSGVAALYVYVSRLRRQLAPLGISVVTRTPGYVLDVVPDAVDIVTFARAVAAAEAALEEGDLEAAGSELRAAGQLWRGEPFQGASSCDDLISESERLHRLRDRIPALEARLLLAKGQARAAADVARTLTDQNPLNEAHWALRMEAEHASGNTAVALALYDECRKHLADVLGIDPGLSLRDLHARLLQEDAQADLSRAPVAQRSSDTRAAAIGRGAQLQEIRAAVEAASEGHGRLLVLEGRAGVGKTYLAERAASIAEHAGWTTAWTRTIESTGAPPLWPWQRILASLPGAIDPTGADELAAVRAGIIGMHDADETRFRLSEALVSRVLAAAADRPLLVVFDDVQWADDLTLQAIGLLASVVRTSSCVVVLTVRQSAGRRPALASVLAALHHETSTRRIPVDEFTSDEIAAELERTSDLRGDDATAVAAQLRERTGGNAFFVTELLAAGSVEGLPTTVADLVQERLAPLSETCRELVETAAIAGMRVDVPLLAAALRASVDDVIARADELCGVGLWRREASGHAFAHSLARDAVLASISRAGATTAHRMLADALEQRHAADVEPVLEAIAYHRYRAASGMSDEKAFRACTAAADRAARVLAFDQAATFRERALTSIPLGDQEARRRADTLLRLTAERRAAGDVIAAASALRQTMRAAHQLHDRDFTVQVLSLLGEVTLWNWRQYGEVDDDAVALLDELLADPSLRPGERVDLSVALAMELYYADGAERSRAVALTDAAIAAVSTAAPRDARRSRAYSAAVFSAWRPGGEGERRAILDDWLGPVSTAGTIPGEIVARLHRASIHLAHGDLDAWIVDVDRAGELLARSGRAEYAAQHAAQLAGASLQAGRLDEARDLMERADVAMRRTSMWGSAWVAGIQRLTLARIEGRVAAIADELLATASPEGQRSLRWAAVLALAESGRYDEARAMQGRWNLRMVPRTSTWSTDFDVAQAAEVAVHLGAPLLSDAYAALARSRSPLLMAGTGIAILGPRDALLARLAERLGRHDHAAEHRERALEITDRMRAALGADPAWPLLTV